MNSLHQFLAAAHQMNVIERWNNKPNLIQENVAAHSFLVTVISWGLAKIAQLNGMSPVLSEVLKRALSHDLHEVITGDILAPTKRATQEMKLAVESLERRAGSELISLLPEAIRPQVEPYVVSPMDDSAEARLVARADMLTAALKAWLEVSLGNQFYREGLQHITGRLAADPAAIDAYQLLLSITGQGNGHRNQPDLSSFLRHLLSLFHVKRWNNLPTLAPKSVAAHSHLVALIAWLLAELENVNYQRQLPVDKIICRALLLEAPKAVTGDILYQTRTATKAMEQEVSVVRTMAAAEIARALPEELREAIGQYLEPLPAGWERVVDDASLIAGYLEAAMEVRLGNSYFRPVLESLRHRIDSPLPTTQAILSDLWAATAG